MILSIHGVSLRDVASTPQQALEIAAKAGFKNIEVPVTTWQPLTNPEIATKKDIAEINGLLKSTGVKASSLGMIWQKNYVIVTSSQADWKRNLDYAKKLFDFSAALGVKVMNFGAPLERIIPANVPYHEGLKTEVKFYKEMCKYAEDVGVIFCVEHIVRSHINNVGDTTKSIIDMIEAVDSPSFQMVAQVHQMAYMDLDVPAAIRASGKMIKLVHIADIAGFNPIVDPIQFVTPGKTEKFDFKSVFKAFKDIGYEGEICMEPSPQTLGKDFVSELRKGREFLEAKWKQA